MAAAGSGKNIEEHLPLVKQQGLNTAGAVDFSSATSVALPGTGTGVKAVNIISATSTALTASAAGTNYGLQVDESTASAVTGLKITSAAAAAGLALAVISSGTNENVTINAKGTGTVTINGTATGAITLGQAVTITTGTLTLTSGGVTLTSGNLLLSAGTATVTSANASSLAVGPAGATTPVFVIDSSTASQIAGLKLTGAVTGGTVALITADTGGNTSLTVDGKGTGTIGINTVSSTSGLVTIGNATSMAGSKVNGALIQNHGTAAINSSATATAAQVATGYITSTSGAATTITLPTGTLLGTQLGSVQGTIHDLYIDNTAGANTVTIAVAVNGILSAAAVANGASQGLLTVPSGTTGQACYRLMFSSATAYTFTRIA